MVMIGIIQYLNKQTLQQTRSVTLLQNLSNLLIKSKIIDAIRDARITDIHTVSHTHNDDGVNILEYKSSRIDDTESCTIVTI